MQQRLTEKHFKTFLPTNSVTRHWSDRKKVIQEPLFKSYLFVRSEINTLHQIKTIAGFAYFLQFGGYPVTISENQIRQIQKVTDHYSDTTSIASKLIQGDSVTITKGPLKAMTGELIEFQGKKKVAIEVSQLNQSMLVSLPLSCIAKQSMRQA
ncbi:UpxY family transcription antiterminator [Vibrio quintilis]|nr:UpxY family transcription antiterminator [Vibrio quintilis]